MKFLACLPAILLLAACTPQSGSNAAPSPPPAASAPAEAASAPANAGQASAGWVGSYQGVLPCPSCEGIEIILQLKEDGSYQLKETYQQRQPLTIETSGHFTWRTEGQILQLDKAGNEQLYQIDGDRIWLLDADGNRVEGDLADKYILRKAG